MYSIIETNYKFKRNKIKSMLSKYLKVDTDSCLRQNKKKW